MPRSANGSTELTARRWFAALLAAGPACVAFALYLSTLAPTVHWSDTAELQRTVSTLALPHPTGYPLYLLLGKLWVELVPLRDVAWRANLLSAALGSVAVGLATLVVWRISRQAIGALTAGLVLATAPSFWSQSIVAEVYTLHGCLLLALFLALLAPRPRLWLVALLVGLGLAHHRMAVLALPGVTWAVLARRQAYRLSRRGVLAALGALAVGVSPYLLTLRQIGWRNPTGFATHVLHTGETWWSVAAPGRYVIDVLWPIARQELGVIGFLLAMFGLFRYTFRRDGEDRAAGVLIAVSWLLSFAFFVFYRVPDVHALATHFLVLHALAIGLGAAAVVALLERRLPERARPAASIAAGALLAVALLVQVPRARAAVEASDADWTYPRDRALSILRDTGGGAVLAADYLLGQTVRYLQDVEGLRPDVHTVVHDREPDWARSLLEQGRPAYLWGTGWREAFDGDASVVLIPAEHDRFEEGLFRLEPADAWADAPAVTVGVGVGGAGSGEATIAPWPLRADAPAEIKVCWNGWPRQDWGDVVGLRWSVGFDDAWFTHDFGAIGPPDDDACTRHPMVMPPAPASATGAGTLTLYGLDGSSEATWQESFAVDVRPSTDQTAKGRTQYALPATGSYAHDGLTLDSLHHPPSTRPGVDLPVRMAWWWTGQDLRDPIYAWGSWGNSAGCCDAETTPAPLAETLPEGGSALVGAALVLPVPRDVAPGRYTVSVTNHPSRSVRVESAVTIEDWDRLWSRPAVQRPLDETIDGGAISLVGADVGRNGTRAAVTLYWKSERETDRDWKVFVHVVDADGERVAQADGFPGEGLRWTNGWRRGEFVADAHAIELPPDTPPGPLRVLAGMYDPESGDRASAYRADGSPWPDFAVDLGAIGTGTDVLESSP